MFFISFLLFKNDNSYQIFHKNSKFFKMIKQLQMYVDFNFLVSTNNLHECFSTQKCFSRHHNNIACSKIKSRISTLDKFYINQYYVKLCQTRQIPSMFRSKYDNRCLTVHICFLGYAGGVGKITYVQQYQQAGTEKKSASCVGRTKLVRQQQ